MNIYEELERRALEFVSETGNADTYDIREYIGASLEDDYIDYYGEAPATTPSINPYLEIDKLVEKIEQAQQEEQDYNDAKEEARTH